jgi:hypothetical protein
MRVGSPLVPVLKSTPSCFNRANFCCLSPFWHPSPWVKAAPLTVSEMVLGQLARVQVETLGRAVRTPVALELP